MLFSRWALACWLTSAIFGHVVFLYISYNMWQISLRSRNSRYRSACKCCAFIRFLLVITRLVIRRMFDPLPKIQQNRIRISTTLSSTTPRVHRSSSRSRKINRIRSTWSNIRCNWNWLSFNHRTQQNNQDSWLRAQLINTTSTKTFRTIPRRNSLWEWFRLIAPNRGRVFNTDDSDGPCWYEELRWHLW